MDEKNNNHITDDGNNPLEIPDNNPPSETAPIKSAGKRKTRVQSKMKGIKLAYALCALLAFGAALTAHLTAQQSQGELKVPIESDYVTMENVIPTLPEVTKESDYEVRQNVTDVPDTRQDTTAPEETSEKVTETVTKASPYAEPYKDYFCLPLGTEILKDYSPTVPSYNPTLNDWRTHGGIDFQAPDGSQVKAISYGTVLKIYEDSLYGTVIEIDHGNNVTARYCGMNKDALEVSEGDVVKSGALIGYLGVVPCEKSELSHLHFETYMNDKNVDPLALMNK